LGLRSAGLVGISIPGAFLSGILAISLMGYSMNIVVLFALIMAVGMLVDGAIVVVELAERNLRNGYSPREAYFEAAKRMAWPITASTATTLAAFMPLVFWPGIIGEFMKYLPITLLVTLSMSLLMALLFVPTIGALLRGGAVAGQDTARLVAAESDLLGEARLTLEQGSGMLKHYLRLLGHGLRHPVKVLLAAVLILVLTMVAYGKFGKGVEFFPNIEPEVAQLSIHARGDLAVAERDALVQEVEARILDMVEFESVYARSGLRLGNDSAEDVIGRIQLQLVDWELRRPASEILAEVRQRTADLAGIVVETEVQQNGPTSGKPVQVEISARDSATLPAAVEHVRRGMTAVGGFIDITDNRPLPGIDWRVEVDRESAAKFGTDISTIGSAIQLLTNGILLGDYRPDNADDEVDIRVRFPEGMRNLDQFDRLTVGTALGNVPIGNFVTRSPAPRVGSLERTDGIRVMKISADVHDDFLVNDKVLELQNWLAENPAEGGASILFRGENEDQAEAQAFLSRAFGVALFMMAIILLVQFNSFYQTLLILTAVLFSTAGVLIALMVTGRPFGVVMSGIGVISLAGIVVNNNIVLIDTYNQLRKSGAEALEAALLTCAQRMRPVLLTTVTTILGLMPMAIGMNFDLLNRHIQFGGPSTQWWTQLATAVAGGLAFATVLTLVLTPCLLVLGEKLFRQKALPAESLAEQS
ncbi:MAG TPA: efflux RND transporter permease subunit, partial [Pseudomonadaceae bacterium]|nr:efflux RND transporter permease subunit [Pseudomonadaceae bacterium]